LSCLGDVGGEEVSSSQASYQPLQEPNDDDGNYDSLLDEKEGSSP